MKKISKIILIAGLLLATRGIALADVTLTVRNGADVIFSGPVAVPTGTTSVNDSNATTHTIDASSVLAILESAAVTSGNFSISNLTYYGSFTPPSLYLKCIIKTADNVEKCDDWQYVVVNDPASFESIDQKIVSDGKSVYVYFGPQNNVNLDFNDITTNGNVKVTAQKYDYQNNSWIPAIGATVGVTVPGSWPTVEIQTAAVDGNGQATFSSIPVGTYSVGIQPDYFPVQTLNVSAPAVISGGGGSLYTPPVNVKKQFDVNKAFEFITSQQKEDGSFGEGLYTDWVALALASGNNQNQTIKLIKYFGESRGHSLTGEAKPEGMLLTDYERHAMALMALGLNPYNTNGENYIQKITDSFDGKQFGDANEDNDDIFALIVLLNAGFSQTDKMITDDISFILGRQKENGSWDESVDMTGAGIQALMSTADKSCFLLGSLSAPAGGALPLDPPHCETPQNKELLSAVSEAKEFLKENQKDDGGWNNVSSTAWATGGILALDEKPEDWVKGGNTPFDYLGKSQDTDGGIKNEYPKNKIWETAYALTAASGKTWMEILQKFEKPKEEIIVKEEVLKPVVVKNTVIKNSLPKTITEKKPDIKNKIEIQTTAVNSLDNSTTEPAKKGWFENLLNKIFSIF